MNIRVKVLNYDFCTNRSTGYYYPEEMSEAINEELAELNITEDNLIEIKTNLCSPDPDQMDLDCGYNVKQIVTRFVVTIIYKDKETVV
ncbi:MAG: hypothetical protein K2P14_03590 [Anaeroplasmataceae bacterium]|nr:hypothetical protein [Anaeroplasmataceae bacterium]